MHCNSDKGYAKGACEGEEKGIHDSGALLHATTWAFTSGVSHRLPSFQLAWIRSALQPQGVPIRRIYCEILPCH